MVGENEEKYLESLDPYKHPEDKWVDDVSKWPPIEYPDLYMYLIEAPGEFTLNDTEFFKTVSPKLEDMFVKYIYRKRRNFRGGLIFVLFAGEVDKPFLL